MGRCLTSCLMLMEKVQEELLLFSNPFSYIASICGESGFSPLGLWIPLAFYFLSLSFSPNRWLFTGNILRKFFQQADCRIWISPGLAFEIIFFRTLLGRFCDVNTMYHCILSLDRMVSLDWFLVTIGHFMFFGSSAMSDWKLCISVLMIYIGLLKLQYNKFNDGLM